MGAALRWDVFCRVIDNHGDLGVCWRLAADLATRGHTVRLWVDDARALAWMAPAGVPGVTALPWRDPLADETPGDVVIEAFGCDPPEAFVHKMQGGHCTWINLEYLSAEPYVERSHGLASPQFSGPGAGLTKWFFYPGFTAATGGLLREPALQERLHRLDRSAFLRRLGVEPDTRPVVSLFAYPHAPVDTLLRWLAPTGAQLLACPGPVQTAVLEHARAYPTVHVTALPWLSQDEYDTLLASCDLNFVRGEDSFVRAQWAGAPFVWQIYVQDDGVHEAKLQAFLDRHLAGSDPGLATTVSATFRRWNGFASTQEAAPPGLPPLTRWRAHTQRWRAELSGLTDLTSQLTAFVNAKR